ncbi:hypothetical protein BC833DRAFT_593775 [Globomyces pollinis-pini]|nr:hypothetical protein BC833DRAFT_593775 [Globomyces pollinis-pini]
MFSKITAEVTGSADVCKCISPQQFSNEPSLSYLLPDEIAYIFLKSSKEEHIFTNQAYITCKGSSATTTRRLIERYEYSTTQIINVNFETAGMSMSDRDVELKFTLLEPNPSKFKFNSGSHNISIDIWKNEIEIAKTFYKTIVELSKVQKKNIDLLALSKYAVGSFKVPQSSKCIYPALEFAEACVQRYCPHSYQQVFEQCLSV